MLVVIVMLLGAACGGRVRAPASGPGGPTATAAVERFLQLGREKDYVQMGWVFGTAEGPVIRRWPLPEVEQRMYALATVLQHDSFVVGPSSVVPGRIGSAESFRVQLRRGNQTFHVPVTAVRGPDRRWFVETVDIQAVTNTNAR